MRPQPAEIEYPESDGKRMSDNTLQAFWIILLYTNLDAIFPDFVAADLLWYPVRNRKKSLAPDVMVALGRPKGYRGSYFPWNEDNIQPQVVFEIRSPSNTNAEMAKKRADYERYGVEEYYHYDPHRNVFEVFLRQGQALKKMPVVGSFDSPLLKIRFLLKPDGLKVLDPTGQPFRVLEEERQRAEEEYQRAEEQQQRAEEEHQRAEEERQRAEEERRLRQETEARLRAEQERAERLYARLKALGLEP
jgi:Uma2 family endonuclease